MPGRTYCLYVLLFFCLCQLCAQYTIHCYKNICKYVQYIVLNIEPLICTSLTDTHHEAIKTCIEGFNHGTRIGRSWGAALQHDQYLMCDEGSGIRNAGRCTKAEYDNKLAPDLIGNLANAKVQNALSVINVFISKYVVDLKWDFLIIGQKCERLEPWNTAHIPQDITEGICGIISMGHATDCQGFVNRMHYQQRRDKDITYFDCRCQ